jgi:hypothetical protein
MSRRGNWKVGLSHSKYSSRHIVQMISMASAHSARLASRSTWNAVCSIGVDRPVPHSTRPFERMSAVATFSATRAGCVNPYGSSVTPKPSRMFWVAWVSAPITTSGAGQCDRPSRKWCSTNHAMWKPTSSARRIWSSIS